MSCHSHPKVFLVIVLLLLVISAFSRANAAPYVLDCNSGNINEVNSDYSTSHDYVRIDCPNSNQVDNRATQILLRNVKAKYFLFNVFPSPSGGKLNSVILDDLECTNQIEGCIIFDKKVVKTDALAITNSRSKALNMDADSSTKGFSFIRFANEGVDTLVALEISDNHFESNVSTVTGEDTISYFINLQNEGMKNINSLIISKNNFTVSTLTRLSANSQVAFFAHHGSSGNQVPFENVVSAKFEHNFMSSIQHETQTAGEATKGMTAYFLHCQKSLKRVDDIIFSNITMLVTQDDTSNMNSRLDSLYSSLVFLEAGIDRVSSKLVIKDVTMIVGINEGAKQIVSTVFDSAQDLVQVGQIHLSNIYHVVSSNGNTLKSKGQSNSDQNTISTFYLENEVQWSGTAATSENSGLFVSNLTTKVDLIGDKMYQLVAEQIRLFELSEIQKIIIENASLFIDRFQVTDTDIEDRNLYGKIFKLVDRFLPPSDDSKQFEIRISHSNIFVNGQNITLQKNGALTLLIAEFVNGFDDSVKSSSTKQGSIIVEDSSISFTSFLPRNVQNTMLSDNPQYLRCWILFLGNSGETSLALSFTAGTSIISRRNTLLQQQVLEPNSVDNNDTSTSESYRRDSRLYILFVQNELQYAKSIRSEDNKIQGFFTFQHVAIARFDKAINFVENPTGDSILVRGSSIIYDYSSAASSPALAQESIGEDITFSPQLLYLPTSTAGATTTSSSTNITVRDSRVILKHIRLYARNTGTILWDIKLVECVRLRLSVAGSLNVVNNTLEVLNVSGRRGVTAPSGDEPNFDQFDAKNRILTFTEEIAENGLSTVNFADNKMVLLGVEVAMLEAELFAFSQKLENIKKFVLTGNSLSATDVNILPKDATKWNVLRILSAYRPINNVDTLVRISGNSIHATNVTTIGRPLSEIQDLKIGVNLAVFHRASSGLKNIQVSENDIRLHDIYTVQIGFSVLLFSESIDGIETITVSRNSIVGSNLTSFVPRTVKLLNYEGTVSSSNSVSQQQQNRIIEISDNIFTLSRTMPDPQQSSDFFLTPQQAENSKKSEIENVMFEFQNSINNFNTMKIDNNVANFTSRTSLGVVNHLMIRFAGNISNATTFNFTRNQFLSSVSAAKSAITVLWWRFDSSSCVNISWTKTFSFNENRIEHSASGNLSAEDGKFSNRVDGLEGGHVFIPPPISSSSSQLTSLKENQYSISRNTIVQKKIDEQVGGAACFATDVDFQVRTVLFEISVRNVNLTVEGNQIEVSQLSACVSSQRLRVLSFSGMSETLERELGFENARTEIYLKNNRITTDQKATGTNNNKFFNGTLMCSIFDLMQVRSDHRFYSNNSVKRSVVKFEGNSVVATNVQDGSFAGLDDNNSGQTSFKHKAFGLFFILVQASSSSASTSIPATLMNSSFTFVSGAKPNTLNLPNPPARFFTKFYKLSSVEFLTRNRKSTPPLALIGFKSDYGGALQSNSLDSLNGANMIIQCNSLSTPQMSENRLMNDALVGYNKSASSSSSSISFNFDCPPTRTQTPPAPLRSPSSSSTLSETSSLSHSDPSLSLPSASLSQPSLSQSDPSPASFTRPSLTLSDLNPSHSETKSISKIPLPKKKVVNQLIAEEAQIAVQAVSSVTSPMAFTMMYKVLGVATLSECNNNKDGEIVSDVSIGGNPTRLEIKGDPVYFKGNYLFDMWSTYRGALLGNSLIIFAFWLILIICGCFLYWWRKKKWEKKGEKLKMKMSMRKQKREARLQKKKMKKMIENRTATIPAGTSSPLSRKKQAAAPPVVSSSSSSSSSTSSTSDSDAYERIIVDDDGEKEMTKKRKNLDSFFGDNNNADQEEEMLLGHKHNNNHNPHTTSDLANALVSSSSDYNNSVDNYNSSNERNFETTIDKKRKLTLDERRDKHSAKTPDLKNALMDMELPGKVFYAFLVLSPPTANVIGTMIFGFVSDTKSVILLCLAIPLFLVFSPVCFIWSEKRARNQTENLITPASWLKPRDHLPKWKQYWKYFMLRRTEWESSVFSRMIGPFIRYYAMPVFGLIDFLAVNIIGFATGMGEVCLTSACCTSALWFSVFVSIVHLGALAWYSNFFRDFLPFHSRFDFCFAVLSSLFSFAATILAVFDFYDLQTGSFLAPIAWAINGIALAAGFITGIDIIGPVLENAIEIFRQKQSGKKNKNKNKKSSKRKGEKKKMKEENDNTNRLIDDIGTQSDGFMLPQIHQRNNFTAKNNNRTRRNFDQKQEEDDETVLLNLQKQKRELLKKKKKERTAGSDDNDNNNAIAHPQKSVHDIVDDLREIIVPDEKKDTKKKNLSTMETDDDDDDIDSFFKGANPNYRRENRKRKVNNENDDQQREQDDPPNKKKSQQQQQENLLVDTWFDNTHPSTIIPLVENENNMKKKKSKKNKNDNKTSSYSASKTETAATKKIYQKPHDIEPIPRQKIQWSFQDETPMSPSVLVERERKELYSEREKEKERRRQQQQEKEEEEQRQRQQRSRRRFDENDDYDSEYSDDDDYDDYYSSSGMSSYNDDSLSDEADDVFYDYARQNQRYSNRHHYDQPDMRSQHQPLQQNHRPHQRQRQLTPYSSSPRRVSFNLSDYDI